MLPNFIGIGVQRAATTWVYNCLSRHPEICLSQKKELHYFTANFEKGTSWYEMQFAHHGSEKIVGEISPNYIYHEQAIARMKDLVPDAKLLLVLRDPVDRAVSAYRFFNHRYPDRTFEQAIEFDPGLIDRSMYAENLKTLWRYFPREQVKVMFYEDIERTPRKFLRDLFKFLGVDENIQVQGVQNRYNRQIYPGLQKFLIKARLGAVIELVKKTNLGDGIRKSHSQASPPPKAELSSDLSKQLSLRFSEDVSELEELLSRDLGHWLR